MYKRQILVFHPSKCTQITLNYFIINKMKNSFYFLLFFPFTVLFAQNTYLVKENDQLRLTPAGASFLAKLPLHCIHTEYPNKTGHTIEAENDAKLTPKQLHPAFYGWLDWHLSLIHI